ncbi:rod shape-determining protein MreC [Halalkalibacillus sediminis]|uniref:Cell shape-determining protein MreC n=1 Tax=Halalkalibacillus sediminis TaxID=2018042 RepID=A0A2I0QXQ4_9BACI|nr:rod shape-determining protein MreC [Halalkalibacillus sediminis]PKR79121.1 rod shape-determining protein MreC [Halalkalibacillus sediminis]
MPSFLRKRKLIFFLVFIIFVVAIIGYSIRSDEQSSLPAQFVADTVGFFQNIAHQPIQLVVGLTEDIKNIRNVYQQNEVLKEELQDYKTLAFQVNELEKENDELRAITEMEDSISDFSPTKATVIARSPDLWFDQLTINKGQIHGVEQNMAVSTPEGMVGKVIESSQLTSTVQLLSGFDENNRISVTVDGDEDVFGMIEGYDKEKRALLFREIGSEGNIEEGQTIVSSGLGGVFPRGLLIGTIETVELDQYGLTQIAYVKPAADLYNVNHLMIIDRDIHSPILDEEEEE